MSQNLTDEQIELHDRIYRAGWKKIEREVLIQGQQHLSKPGWLTQRKLKKALSLFKQTLQINAANWGSMWALGKIYERLGDNETAFNWFIRAYEIEKNNIDVIREAALCAMNLGRSEEAVELTIAAIELKPNDFGLVSNLALALLIDRKPELAKEKAEEAVRATPEDLISQNTLKLINDVISGNKPYPSTIKDLM